MPVCKDCGNREAFKHYGYGHELREYDPDTGEYLRSPEADVVSDKVRCVECDSNRVTFG